MQISPERNMETELAKNYKLLNTSFEKKITFHLGAEAGFFSEFNNMVLAMIYCLENNIRFSLYSKRANFALSNGWADFFTPFCKERTFFLHSRYNRRTYQMRNAKTLPPKVLKLLSGDDYLTQDIWDHMRTPDFSNKKFTIPDLDLYDAALLEATQKIIEMIWKYNSSSNKVIEEYKDSINLPGHYISIHIRAGDKIKEINTYNIHEYMAKATELSPNKSAFILTDNYLVFEELRELYKDWNFHTLCHPQERGYVHSEFVKLDKHQRYLQHLKLFASLDICAASEKFIGTYSSNPGMFMGMRIGEENCIGIDYDSWVLW